MSVKSFCGIILRGSVSHGNTDYIGHSGGWWCEPCEGAGSKTGSTIYFVNSQIDMRGSTHEVDRYSQYQLPPGRAQSTFLLLHQRCGCGKVLLRYFLTEKVTKR